MPIRVRPSTASIAMPMARSRGVMDELCVFLCDHHSGRMTNIDVGVIDFLASLMAATGQTSAVVLSAFRSAETNAMLASTTLGIAENSQHIYGRALDVRFATNLRDAVARVMRRGGVGWSPRSGFIHLDTGPVLNWDLDNKGLQHLLIMPRATPLGPSSKGEMLVNGPGTLIVGGRKPPVILPGRVLASSRQRVGDGYRCLRPRRLATSSEGRSPWGRKWCISRNGGFPHFHETV